MGHSAYSSSDTKKMYRIHCCYAKLAKKKLKKGKKKKNRHEENSIPLVE